MEGRGLSGDPKTRFLRPVDICRLLCALRGEPCGSESVDAEGYRAAISLERGPQLLPALWQDPGRCSVNYLVEGGGADPRRRMTRSNSASTSTAPATWNATSGRNRALYVIDARYAIFTLRYSAYLRRNRSGSDKGPAVASMRKAWLAIRVNPVTQSAKVEDASASHPEASLFYILDRSRCLVETLRRDHAQVDRVSVSSSPWARGGGMPTVRAALVDQDCSATGTAPARAIPIPVEGDARPPGSGWGSEADIHAANVLHMSTRPIGDRSAKRGRSAKKTEGGGFVSSGALPPAALSDRPVRSTRTRRQVDYDESRDPLLIDEPILPHLLSSIAPLSTASRPPASTGPTGFVFSGGGSSTGFAFSGGGSSTGFAFSGVSSSTGPIFLDPASFNTDPHSFKTDPTSFNTDPPSFKTDPTSFNTDPASLNPSSFPTHQVPASFFVQVAPDGSSIFHHHHHHPMFLPPPTLPTAVPIPSPYTSLPFPPQYPNPSLHPPSYPYPPLLPPTYAAQVIPMPPPPPQTVTTTSSTSSSLFTQPPIQDSSAASTLVALARRNNMQQLPTQHTAPLLAAGTKRPNPSTSEPF